MTHLKLGAQVSYSVNDGITRTRNGTVVAYVPRKTSLLPHLPPGARCTAAPVSNVDRHLILGDDGYYYAPYWL